MQLNWVCGFLWPKTWLWWFKNKEVGGCLYLVTSWCSQQECWPHITSGQLYLCFSPQFVQRCNEKKWYKSKHFKEIDMVPMWSSTLWQKGRIVSWESLCKRKQREWVGAAKTILWSWKYWIGQNIMGRVEEFFFLKKNFISLISYKIQFYSVEVKQKQ